LAIAGPTSGRRATVAGAPPPAADDRLFRSPDLQTGIQDNNWVLQIVSSCDLTPGTTSAGETEDEAGFVYRFEGDEISQSGFSTKCMNSSKASVLVVISNLPTGNLTYLDADYTFRLTNTGNKQ
jgi:hypothetical protein